MAKQSADRIKSGHSKQKKSHRRSRNGKVQLFWGIHPVLEALLTSPASVKEVILEKKSGARIQEIVDLAEEKKIGVRYDKTVFQKAEIVGGERHQGVAALIAFPYVDFARILSELAEEKEPPFILVLDSIQDPRNLGAIIRSAVAAGCRKLILPKDRSAPLTGTVAKTSAGAVFHIDICRVTNLATSIDALKKAGIWVFATAALGPLTIYQADFRVPVCLVIGNEEKGVRPLVKKHCDGLVSIPMAGRLDSLNASVAAGVALFEIARQRAQ
jgi:23S rRNA (guanosine2251-2'-O)-methyltransferase